MKIVFHSNQLSLRGTEVALFDYAYFNQKILGNDSVVVYDRNNVNNTDEVIQKFEQAFPTYGYDSFDEVDSIVKKHEASLLYCIKSGKRDGKVSKIVPTMVHAVFPTSISQMHGAAFAYVSEWLSSLCSNGQVPYVPHMVHLPSLAPDMPRDLRTELGIPPDATVFATYGGATSFDIKFVREIAIPAALAARDDLYFIFMNIEKFMNHPRAMFLPGSTRGEDKVRFIHTSDAMLHARESGESFGLACGEFSILNKPVLTYANSRDKCHLEILGEKAFVYTSTSNLEQLLVNFDRVAVAQGDWDGYSRKYGPATVMQSFEKNLIEVALKNGVADMPIKLSLHTRMRSALKVRAAKILKQA